MTYIRIRYRKQGRHFRCRLFTSQDWNGAYANCGELTFDENEFMDVRDRLSRCEWIFEGEENVSAVG